MFAYALGTQAHFGQSLLALSLTFTDFVGVENKR